METLPQSLACLPRPEHRSSRARRSLSELIAKVSYQHQQTATLTELFRGNTEGGIDRGDSDASTAPYSSFNTACEGLDDDQLAAVISGSLPGMRGNISVRCC
jgi:hypothetical protein